MRLPLPIVILLLFAAALLMGGCADGATLVATDPAFLRLEGEIFTELFGAATQIESYSVPPSVDLLATEAEEGTTERIVLSPLLYRLAAPLRQRLPGVEVLAVAPPGAEEEAESGTVTIDPAAALPLLVELIEETGEGERGGSAALIVYAREIAPYRELAEALAGRLAAEYPGAREPLALGEGDGPEIVASRIRNESPRVLVLLCGAAGSDILAGLAESGELPLVVSDAPPPPAAAARGYLLRPDWRSLYRSLIEGDETAGAWRLEAFGRR